MTASPQLHADVFDTAKLIGGLYGEGIISCKGAFSQEWVRGLREDIDLLFAEAQARPDGALQRGPNRFYVEVHPERIRGFIELATHPWITAVCRSVLGPEYRIVETGFDVPGPGAQKQPWHRDFAIPHATAVQRRLNSLAFNLTTVDVTEEMGPFEIAPGTQWDEIDKSDDPTGMFPPASSYPRYESRAQKKYPCVGDVSARSALAIHRGTANVSKYSRPVFVLGVDAPDASNAEHHDLQVSRQYWQKLPLAVQQHLTCRIVEQLEPIVQVHTIDGLLAGA
ncbi:MAG: phytanoyl-CoA dioxygenase family protein [Pseudomonadota bacterium]